MLRIGKLFVAVFDHFVVLECHLLLTEVLPERTDRFMHILNPYFLFVVRVQLRCFLGVDNVVGTGARLQQGLAPGASHTLNGLTDDANGIVVVLFLRLHGLMHS